MQECTRRVDSIEPFQLELLVQGSLEAKTRREEGEGGYIQGQSTLDLLEEGLTSGLHQVGERSQTQDRGVAECTMDHF
jgi:hypothetical protein